MKTYKRIPKSIYIAMLILMAILIVRPVEGQSNSNSPVDEADPEPQIFLPIVAGQSEVGFAANPNSNGNGNSTGNGNSNDNSNGNGNGKNDHDRIPHHGTEHLNRSRFAALGGVWPPQPKSMRKVKWNSVDTVLERMAVPRTKGYAALENEVVRSALGERFSYNGTVELAEKNNPNRSDVRNTYFSYSNNQVVEVTVEQNQVTDVLVTPANEYQPPLADNEMEKAIEIARDHFAEAGNSRIVDLDGYAIRAFPPNSEEAYYDNRMAYISFHPEVDSPPEYVAWVDLTNQVVFKAREE